MKLIEILKIASKGEKGVNVKLNNKKVKVKTKLTDFAYIYAYMIDENIDYAIYKKFFFYKKGDEIEVYNFENLEEVREFLGGTLPHINIDEETFKEIKKKYRYIPIKEILIAFSFLILIILILKGIFSFFFKKGEQKNAEEQFVFQKVIKKDKYAEEKKTLYAFYELEKIASLLDNESYIYNAEKIGNKLIVDIAYLYPVEGTTKKVIYIKNIKIPIFVKEKIIKLRKANVKIKKNNNCEAYILDNLDIEKNTKRKIIFKTSNITKINYIINNCPIRLLSLKIRDGEINLKGEYVK